MGIRVGFGAAAEKAEEEEQAALWRAPIVVRTIQGLQECMGFLGVPPVAINQDCYKVLSRHGALDPLDIAVHLTWDLYENSPPERVLGAVPEEVVQVLAYIRNIEVSDNPAQAMKTAVQARNPAVMKFIIGTFCAEYEMDANFDPKDGGMDNLFLACEMLFSRKRIWEKTPVNLLQAFAGHLEDLGGSLGDTAEGQRAVIYARKVVEVARNFQAEEENDAAANLMTPRLGRLKQALRPRLKQG